MSTSHAWLQEALLRELRDDETDWLRLNTLSKRVRVEPEVVHNALVRLEVRGEVRRPLRARPWEQHFFRATDRGLSYGEHWRWVVDKIEKMLL